MNIKKSIDEKIEERRTDIQAGCTVIAVLAATYFLGKSRGKHLFILCQDDDNVLRLENVQ